MSMARPRRSVIYRLGDDPNSYATAKDLQVDVLLFDIKRQDWATGGVLWSEKS